MFIEHYNIILNRQNLIITTTIVIMIIVFDYLLIDNHPNMLCPTEHFISSQVSEDIIIADKDIQQIIKNYDASKAERDLDDDEEKNIQRQPKCHKSYYQLPTDKRKSLYKIKSDCYKRGNNINSNKTPTKVLY